MNKRRILSKVIALTVLVVFLITSYGNIAFAISVEKIDIEIPTDVLIKDITLPYKVVAIYKNGLKEELKDVKVESGNEKIISVEDKTIKSIDIGETDIKVLYSGKKASKHLSVKTVEEFFRSYNPNFTSDKKIKIEWERDDNKTRIWWTKTDEFPRYKIMRREARGGTFATYAEGDGNEFTDKEIDPFIEYEYIVYLVHKEGYQSKLKRIYTGITENNKKLFEETSERGSLPGISSKTEYTVTSISDFTEITEDMPIKEVNENLITQSLNERIKITDEIINKYDGNFTFKYELQANQNPDKQNIEVFKTTEDGKYVPLDSEQIKNIDKNEIKVKIKDGGIYIIRDKNECIDANGIRYRSGNSEEITVDISKNTDDKVPENCEVPKNLIECVFEQPFVISEQKLNENNKELQIKYLFEERPNGDYEIELFRVDEANNLIKCAPEQWTLDKTNQLITVKNIEPGAYVVRSPAKEEEKIRSSVAEGSLAPTVRPFTIEQYIEAMDDDYYRSGEDIEIGSSGPQVVELQQKLMRLGMDLGGYGATGYYGEFTVAAIKAIQELKGLPTVGRYGPATRSALTELIGKIDSKGNYPEKNQLLSIYRKNAAGLTPNSNLDLEIGSSGPSVTIMQEKLLKLGFDLGGHGATGYFGNYTVAALKAIQNYKGYEVVGRYGPKTRAALEELLSKVDTNGNYPEKQILLQKYNEYLSDVDLDLGTSGAAVKAMQEKLLKLGFDLGGYGATGYFGNYTVAALKAIQAYMGFEVVGRYGPKTRDAVRNLLSKTDANGNYPEKNGLMAKYKEMLYDVDLEPGSTGDAVKELQKKLLMLGIDLGGYGATGTFGRYTEAAMRAIQELKGYEVVGRYGPKTRAALKEILSNVDANGNYPEKARLLELYNKYVRVFAAVDEFTNVSGSYRGQIKYYDQEDPRWGDRIYGDSTMAKSACGPTAMAIVLSSMKNMNIEPPELCDYALNHGFRISGQGTSRSFFAAVAAEDKYRINCLRLSKWDLPKVKEMLASGKRMAIAIMTPGQFTAGGHYIVLNGVESIDGKNYFNVLDPHRDNHNYINDGSLIDDVKNDGRVKARTSIFASQCDEYWVFDVEGIGNVSENPIVQAKLNLEKLNYTGVRNANGEIDDQWSSNFESVLMEFIRDYNLSSKYNELSDAEKRTVPLTWIKQAISGQLARTTGTSETKGGEEVNVDVLTVTGNFFLGIGDAAVETGKGLWKFITDPVTSTKELGEGLAFLGKAVIPTSEEHQQLLVICNVLFEELKDEFTKGDANVKARMIGRLIGEIILFFATDGIVKGGMYALEGAAKAGKLSGAIRGVLSGEKKANEVIRAVVAGSEAAIKAVSEIKKLLKESAERVFEIVKSVFRNGDDLKITTTSDVELVMSRSRTKAELISEGMTEESAERSVRVLEEGCFAGNTLVITKYGMKKIEDVKEGEYVFAKDVYSGNVGFKKVLNVYIKSADTFVKIRVNGDIIRCTASHLFYVENSWWKAAENLEKGDRIVTSTGEVADIESVEVEKLAQHERIYNLNVEDYHTYFVGNSSLLVHNDCSEGLARLIREGSEQVIDKTEDEIAEELAEAATGQLHHILSNKVMRELNNHKTLKGVFNREDPIFKYRAASSESHKGYQRWHRDVDNEIVDWLEKNIDATPRQFKDFINNVYNRPEIRIRIPGVNVR